MSEPAASSNQRFHLRAGGRRRDIVTTLQNATVYVDRESGTEFELVGKVLPLAPSDSRLTWSEANLRTCGCTRNQLVQRDLNDCPYCGRRMPAVDSAADGGN